MNTTTRNARLARFDLRMRQNEARGFEGLHGVKRVARGDYWGGYLHFVVTGDGEILCPKCVHDEFRSIAEAYRTHDRHSGWYPAGITHEGDFEGFYTCAHCGTILSDEEDTDEEA